MSELGRLDKGQRTKFKKERAWAGRLLRDGSLLSSKGIGDQWPNWLLCLERKAGLLGESSDVGSKN